MAYLFRLIAHGVAMVFACWWLLQPLHALAYPASSTPGSCSSAPCYSYRASVGYAYYPTPQEAAQSQVGRTSVGGCGTILTATAYGVGPSAYWTATCTAGSVSPVTFNTTSRTPDPPVYSCPGGGTLSGTSCTCAPGEVDTGSSCEDPVAAACAALGGQTAYLSFNGAVSPGGASCSTAGCAATVGSPVIRAKSASGAWVSEAEATFTGSTCSPSPSQPEASPDTCPNGQQGEVNGVTVCIPYSKNDEVVKESGTTNTETSGSDTTSTTTSSTTSCTNNSCTTTTTTNVSVNGGAPTTTTSEKTEPRDDFCTQNPRSPQCQDSSFGGSCASGFTCQGDAVQCAQARQLHQLACRLDQASDESALYAAEKSAAAGPADISSNTISVGSGSFEAGNALGVAACIPDLAVTVAGQSITLPFSNVCPYLAHLRLMLLAVAWLMAFRIVAKG